MIEPVIIAAVSFAGSQLVLSLVLLLHRIRDWSTSEKLLSLFLLSVLAYVTRPLVQNELLEPALKIIENCLPGLFWLLCSSLFYDDFKVRVWNIALVLATVLTPLIGTLLNNLGWSIPKLLYSTLPQALEFVLLAAALYAVVRFWKSDLVETRRKLRLWFCAVAGGYIFTLIAMRELFFQGAAWLEMWQYLPVGLICLVTNILLLKMTPGIFGPVSEKHAPVIESNSVLLQRPEIEVPESVMTQLDTLMRQQHCYREMGLTIGKLADKLELPEYRLRQYINAGLGFRNFNDYLNGFRIREAGERLSKADDASVAVLTIALETGFRSLSSFNKVFREIYGQTPTEFRQQHIGDSVSISG